MGLLIWGIQILDYFDDLIYHLSPENSNSALNRASNSKWLPNRASNVTFVMVLPTELFNAWIWGSFGLRNSNLSLFWWFDLPIVPFKFKMAAQLSLKSKRATQWILKYLSSNGVTDRTFQYVDLGVFWVEEFKSKFILTIWLLIAPFKSNKAAKIQLLLQILPCSLILDSYTMSLNYMKCGTQIIA